MIQKVLIYFASQFFSLDISHLFSGQPYIISSLRLLLWDCDDRSYSYYIESSINIWEWEMVVDNTRENCKSWQVIRFPPRPVVFIRIVGTHNTANEVSFNSISATSFHCQCTCSISLSNAAFSKQM